jgi:putative ABC transport system substrate-binding protein
MIAFAMGRWESSEMKRGALDRAAAWIAAVLALVTFVASGPVWAQGAAKVARVGTFGSEVSPDSLEAFRQGLRDFGYVEGRTIVIERAKDTGDPAQRAAELVSRKVDVVLVLNTATARVARDSITTIPVVFVTFADPVRVGLVASLARPGGNMTGLTLIGGELAGKRLQLLREALPRLARVAVLWNPANRDTEEALAETRTAARTLGIQLDVHSAQTVQELPGAFAAAAKAGADAIFVLPDSMFFRERRQITALAEKSRLPAIYHWRAYAVAGGFMSYGSSLTASHRRAAYYVDSILKGAKPGDLPVEQPTTFELVINRKAARALGLTLPQSLLVRADEVIQ